jgi:phenylalanine-4-hydroxylase
MKPLNNTIPRHLHKYIVNQNYSEYSHIDHSCWRFIMRISINYFSEFAHKIYLDGLDKTGITINEIPQIEKINQKLAAFGWKAVCVRGFIPPNAFMEFQSLKILPIAADMRSRKNLTYTPAPDIIHEAAGHAPIIADKDYSNYLVNYGEVASKAIMSSEDMVLYYAIRDLSDIKENSNASKNEINYYELKLQEAYKNISYISESSLLARMNWWTVEYGLIGNKNAPKIYGAGLLSSVGESENFRKKTIKKLPLTLDCIKYGYDITEQQPQLFITQSFNDLTKILKDFSRNMSYKIGGIKGLNEAIKANTLCTVELDKTIQISGVIDRYIHKNKVPIFIKTFGPTQLCYKNKEINGHSINYHKEGYSCPIGEIKNINKSLNCLSESEINLLGIKKNNLVELEFSSGINLTGYLTTIIKDQMSLILLTFKDCTIRYNNEMLFKPSWGAFDLLCGAIVNSVYGGPGDTFNYYNQTKNNNEEYIKYNNIKKNDVNTKLNKLHQMVKNLRNKKNNQNEIENIYIQAKSNFQNEWLIFYEILELTNNQDLYWNQEIIEKLDKLIHKNDDLGNAIKRGLELL